MEELNKNGVEIYRFPTDDETVADINNQMNVRILCNEISSLQPLATVCSILSFPFLLECVLNLLSFSAASTSICCCWQPGRSRHKWREVQSQTVPLGNCSWYVVLILSLMLINHLFHLCLIFSFRCTPLRAVSLIVHVLLWENGLSFSSS